ncbi:DUF4391 domain-containing protein [Cellvibrio sp. PSBB023]|uniref:DUF4391 domain-containing protein n=1 Tax=Cellvibrio sp. PSBB023 TaxID=1945512 RepID=UPI000990287C|nr:DUF4391 domain-containing protein [Cellvibrio sp. PSBB023]AQT61869.1 hypothetical protein B0D95_18500 [Cellvibrio sp. PSBB023]
MAEPNLSKGLSLGLPHFEAFLHSLNVPDSCVLNKPLYKKMFQEHADLDAKDKKALKDDVDKIRWLYTLKPTTINIAPYSDDLRDYGELAFLQVELSNGKSAERIGHLINRAIPYPVVIFFCLTEAKETDLSEACEQLAICLADKRINKADKEKWVIEELLTSPWVSLARVTDTEQAFLNSLILRGLPHSNFWQFYQTLMARVQALQCAEISGRFHLVSGESAEQQQEQLQQYKKIEQEVKKLRTQIKQAEFSQQVMLNTQIKHLELKLKQLAELL